MRATQRCGPSTNPAAAPRRKRPETVDGFFLEGPGDERAGLGASGRSGRAQMAPEHHVLSFVGAFNGDGGDAERVFVETGAGEGRDKRRPQFRKPKGGAGVRFGKDRAPAGRTTGDRARAATTLARFMDRCTGTVGMALANARRSPMIRRGTDNRSLRPTSFFAPCSASGNDPCCEVRHGLVSRTRERCKRRPRYRPTSPRGRGTNRPTF